MVCYSQREGDQCYQRTPYHSRRSMIQNYEVEFHLLTLSVLCLMSYVCWLIVFVTYLSYFVFVRRRPFVIHLSFPLLLFLPVLLQRSFFEDWLFLGRLLTLALR